MMSMQDPLQRFLPRPYRFLLGTEAVNIESNDLEIALALRGAYLEGRCGRIVEWTILRDSKADAGNEAITLVEDGTLRALLVGRGIVLVLDRRLCTVLGFVGRWVDMQSLTSVLIPLLLTEQAPRFTNK